MSFPNEEVKAIWAPWRVEYFELPGNSGDFLSEAAQSGDDAAHLVVARRRSSFLIMNRYPYAVGHLMAVPYHKVPDMRGLTDGEKIELWDLAVFAQELLAKTIRPAGFNIGVNLGRCAGAGVIDHLHIHIVPRWEGDSNFMPVLSGMRVMPQALSALYEKLRSAQLGAAS